jgi:small subunit ribosomal protein S3
VGGDRAPGGTATAGCRFHTIRAEIDYGLAEAHTPGAIVVKVWIFKGEGLPAQRAAAEA